MVMQKILLCPGNALEADCVTRAHRAEKGSLVHCLIKAWYTVLATESACSSPQRNMPFRKHRFLRQEEVCMLPLQLREGGSTGYSTVVPLGRAALGLWHPPLHHLSKVGHGLPGHCKSRASLRPGILTGAGRGRQPARALSWALLSLPSSTEWLSIPELKFSLYFL